MKTQAKETITISQKIERLHLAIEMASEKGKKAAQHPLSKAYKAIKEQKNS